MKKDEEKKVRTNKDTKANKSRVPSAYTRTRIILDALVFFIILLATSLSMIIISSALEEPQNYYAKLTKFHGNKCGCS